MNAAVTAINAATDVTSLDKLEDLARQRGIDGVAPVKAALQSKRSQFGASQADAWASTPVAEVPK